MKLKEKIDKGKRRSKKRHDKKYNGPTAEIALKAIAAESDNKMRSAIPPPPFSIPDSEKGVYLFFYLFIFEN